MATPERGTFYYLGLGTLAVRNLSGRNPVFQNHPDTFGVANYNAVRVPRLDKLSKINNLLFFSHS